MLVHRYFENSKLTVILQNSLCSNICNSNAMKIYQQPTQLIKYRGVGTTGAPVLEHIDLAHIM